MQGFRWLRARHQEHQAENRLERLATTSADDRILREAQVLIAGYVKSAQFDPALAQAGNLEALRSQALEVEEEFLTDAGRRIDQVIADIVTENSRLWVRAVYEILFAILPVFLLYRVGKNFFYDTLFHNADYLTTNFYLSAVLFFVLWSGLFVMAFCRRLRRRLAGHIAAMAQSLAERRFSGGLFPKLEEACRQARLKRARLDAVTASVTGMKREIAIGHLGSPRTMPRQLFATAEAK